MPDISPLETDSPVHAEIDLDTTDEAGDELVEESLVEEVSIDGMCGVY